MVQHYRIEGVVRHRKLVQIGAKVTEITLRRRVVGIGLPTRAFRPAGSGFQKETIANHAPAHGIDELRMAPCPEQRVAMEAAGALPHMRRLLGEETAAQRGSEPVCEPFVGGSCQVLTTEAKYPIHSDLSS